ncbi:hypothetical protein NHF45_12915 [Maricaulaceae bacterium NA33B04]|nr:hypothetical protein [Maricaulaceae bacterium NA33B04]
MPDALPPDIDRCKISLIPLLERAARPGKLEPAPKVAFIWKDVLYQAVRKMGALGIVPGRVGPCQAFMVGPLGPIGIGQISGGKHSKKSVFAITMLHGFQIGDRV